MPFLEVRNIDVYYGDVQVIFDLSLRVEEGEVVSIIGANGAGKSSLLRTISGLMEPKKGQILFQNEPIHRLPPEKVVDQGIVHVPEGRKLFTFMTVLDNLRVGAYNSRAQPHEAESLAQVYHLLPRLKERESQLAVSLSGGEQQMVAIGRGMMARPKILMLDEPSLGLAPILIKSIFETVKEVARQGTTVVLVEQDVKHSLALSDRGYVLEHGRIALEGRASDLLDNPHVKKAYLGL
jgi:branched-chain amino acid transport system ATP-binding protein